MLFSIFTFKGIFCSIFSSNRALIDNNTCSIDKVLPCINITLIIIIKKQFLLSKVFFVQFSVQTGPLLIIILVVLTRFYPV